MQNICLIYQLLVDNHSKSLPSLENDRSAPAVHFQMTVIVLFSWYEMLLHTDSFNQHTN